MSFDPITYARLVGSVARLQELHDNPSLAQPGESLAEQARIVAAYASSMDAAGDIDTLIARCPSWPGHSGEPVSATDLGKSPLMWALWLADPKVAEDVRHGARLGKVGGQEARQRLTDALAFVDPGRLPLIVSVLRARVKA